MIRKFKSEFVQNAVTLMSATFVAQIFSYLLTPIITSLYTPEEAGQLGLFLRIVAVCSALATLRYEYALPIVQNESHAYRLYRLINRIVIVFSAIAFLLLLIPVFTDGDSDTYIYYALMPMAIGLTARFNLQTNWSIRLKAIKKIGLSRMSNAIGSSVAKIGFAYLNCGYLGLIYGTIVGLFLANLSFFGLNKQFASIKQKIGPRNYLIAKGQKDFPFINLPHALMDFGRDLLIGILFFYYFSGAEYGLYDLSYRMLRLPLILAGVSLSQVFFQRISEMIREHQDIRPLITKSMKVLVLISLVPFSIIVLFGPDIFSFVFGENWRVAGEYAQVMTPWFAMNFVISPISSIPMVIGRQKEFFKLAILGTTLMIGSLLFTQEVLDMPPTDALLVVSISQFAYLILVMVRIFHFLNIHKQESIKDV